MRQLRNSKIEIRDLVNSDIRPRICSHCHRRASRRKRAAGGKVYRIGMLESVPAARNAANLDALRKGLRDLGYVEGRNLIIEYRSADGRAERFPVLARRTGSSQGRLDRDQGNAGHPGDQERDRNDSGGDGDDGRPACPRGELRASGRQHHGGDDLQHRVDREADRTPQGAGSESLASRVASQHGQSGGPTRMGRDQDGGPRPWVFGPSFSTCGARATWTARSSWPCDSTSTRWSSG